MKIFASIPPFLFIICINKDLGMSVNWSRPRAPTNGEFLNSKNTKKLEAIRLCSILDSKIQRALNFHYFTFKDS